MTTCYRIRVGRSQFKDPHYVTKVGYLPTYTSILVNKSPCSWVNKKVAEQHLNDVKETFASAELEEYEQT